MEIASGALSRALFRMDEAAVESVIFVFERAIEEK